MSIAVRRTIERGTLAKLSLAQCRQIAALAQCGRGRPHHRGRGPARLPAHSGNIRLCDGEKARFPVLGAQGRTVVVQADYDVAIIGAGLGGLTAGAILAENGRKV